MKKNIKLPVIQHYNYNIEIYIRVIYKILHVRLFFFFDIIFFVFPLIKVKKFIKVIENSI